MDNLEKLAAAMVKVQEEIKVAKKDKANPFFKSKYADLGAVWEACHEALTKNGIAVIQRPTFRDGVHLLTTDLLHESGQSISGDYLIRPVKDDPQAMGSAVTYARRYSLAAMVGIICEDDDGAKASTRGKQPGDASAIRDKLLSGKITKADQSALMIAWRKSGKTDEQVKGYLKEAWDLALTAEITKKDYPEILDWCSEVKK